MIEGSIVCSLITKIASWFSRQLQQSACVGFFLAQNDKEATAKNSIFAKLFEWFRTLFGVLFQSIGLKKLLEGSIFKIPYIWCFLTVVSAPFLPTMLVFALVLASMGSFFLELVCNKEKKMQYYAINKYVYLYAGAYLFATIASVTRKGSLYGGLLSICFMLFFIVLINAVKTRKQLHVLLFFFICAGVLVSFYGFYQYMFPAKFSGVWHDKDMFESINFRVYSTFGNPNVLGEYLLLVIPIAFAYVLNSRKMFHKLFFLGCTGAMLLCLIITYSRGCYVGILVAFGLFLVLLDRRFILLGIVGLLAMPFILPETIINRFLSIGNMADSSTSYRFYIYMGTLAMLKEYWLSGIGPGTDAFNQVYPAYAYNSISAPHAHNLFLQVICDAGIVGILLFLAIIYQYYKAAFASLTIVRGKRNRIFIIAGISSISGFFIQSLFDYTFYNYRVMLLFWAALAICILLCSLPRQRKEPSTV